MSERINLLFELGEKFAKGDLAFEGYQKDLYLQLLRMNGGDPNTRDITNDLLDEPIYNAKLVHKNMLDIKT